MSQIDLREIAIRLSDRDSPRSEATLQADIRTLLLAAPLNLTEHGIETVNLETPAGDQRRIDIEAGFAVIEVKRDLRIGNVLAEATQQLAGYVKHRADTMGQRYLGLLTDGAQWVLFHLTREGSLKAVGELVLAKQEPDVDELITWLEGVLATRQQIVPTPKEIETRLGANSPSHRLDFADLSSLYEANKSEPSVALKRELWAKLLTTALGSSFDNSDELFVEHTLLVATAEVIAHAVVGFVPTQLAPATLLSGSLFDQAQIAGVVEEDFFDWIVEVDGGDMFVRGLARRLSRFDWSAVQHDVMKVLYESVIGRADRHSLGEYYTPDWLAARMVHEVVTDPLKQRVLDPACGSGTFLFHAVRHYLSAADSSGVELDAAISGATEHVIGVDIHPLAVTFARVTYLLAIGMARIASQQRGAFSVPVYLGDSLQWGQSQTLLNDGTLTVTTGDGAQLFASELRFPDSLISDARRFDQLVGELASKAADRQPGAPAPPLRETFRRFPMSEAEGAVVEQTFRAMCELHDQGRDHIWGYYVRNLARPRWLSQAPNRVDVLVGNPPWLTFNAVASDLKQEFRAVSQERNLWGGGRSARNHDLAPLFVVRATELYLKQGGRLAFVMPLATLSRQQFAGFRAADYPAIDRPVTVAYDSPWDLDEVRPHPFPVPSCVVFGARVPAPGLRPMPSEKVTWSGTLPSRNVDWDVAGSRLEQSITATVIASGEHASAYARRFESGAKLNPQVLVVVDPVASGPLGVPAGFMRVESHRSSLEKPPWKNVRPLSGTIEAEFVRPVHLGSTVVPYRMLEPLLAVVPWDRSAKRLLADDDELLDRYPELAKWWRRAAALWAEHGTPEKYNLTERIDYQRKLSRQLPPPPERVVYTASGGRIAAARLEDATAVVQHKLYWAATRSRLEAQYLCAVLNSEVVARGLAPYQSRGQFGARDIDLYVWYLPIPEFDQHNAVHVALADLGAQAEREAGSVDLLGVRSFHVARKRVRESLERSGIGPSIEMAVAELLDVPASSET